MYKIMKNIFPSQISPAVVSSLHALPSTFLLFPCSIKRNPALVAQNVLICYRQIKHLRIRSLYRNTLNYIYKLDTKLL